MIKIARNDDLRINDQIENWKTCRLIGADGKQLGVMSVSAALDEADEAGMDLVEIAPSNDPIVCRIMDYGKYKYDRQKKEKEAKRKSKQKQTKEMKFRCNIGDNDYETKKNHIQKFLSKGSDVRVTIMFRGREMSHPELGIELLDRLSSDLEGSAEITGKPSLEGHDMKMTFTPSA